MEIVEIYKRIMQRHCLMADHVTRLAELHVEQGNDINTVSVLLESKPNVNPAPAEMAVHTPSTMPCHLTCERDCVLVENHEPPCVDVHGKDFAGVESKDPGAVVHSAEFAPDSDEAPASEARPITPAASETPAVEPSEPASRRRSKTEYTAREWALSGHFLNYMKKAPFASWTASEQVDKRNAFIAAMPADMKLNRWGQRFEKFCSIVA